MVDRSPELRHTGVVKIHTSHQAAAAPAAAPKVEPHTWGSLETPADRGEAAEGALETCGWCGGEVPEDSPVFACGVKVQNPADLQACAGELVELVLPNAGKTVLAIVPASDSDAGREGYDAMVMVCGKRCKQKLSEVIAVERAAHAATKNDAV